MKIKEIREMSTDELLTRKRELRQESFHLRMQQQSGQLEKPSRLRLLRREVARIETVLTQPRSRQPAKSMYGMNETQRSNHSSADRGSQAAELRKTRVGQVISNKMNKTIVVRPSPACRTPNSARS